MSADLIANVLAQAVRLTTHSWEYGTCAEALMEWYNPSSSVFGNNTFPDGKIPVLQVDDVQSLSYAQPHIWTNSTTLIDGDGAAGDPASLGVSAILIGQTQPEYLGAAQRQADHLLNVVPRWANGAISHRESVAELWADSVYMVPPFLAYWAIQTDDVELLRTAVVQCILYHDVLVVPAGADSAAGLWHHIIGPSSQDLGIWSTGNAWAAAGMTRVLATAMKSRFADAVSSEIAQLKVIIRDILDGAIALDEAEPDEPLLRNYLNDTTWFGDLSGTTLIAATVYRLAILEPAEFVGYTGWADTKRLAIVERIDDTGLLYPVVNPLNWNDRTPAHESPEAENFAVLMFAAYRDFQQ